MNLDHWYIQIESKRASEWLIKKEWIRQSEREWEGEGVSEWEKLELNVKPIFCFFYNFSHIFSAFGYRTQLNDSVSTENHLSVRINAKDITVEWQKKQLTMRQLKEMFAQQRHLVTLDAFFLAKTSVWYTNNLVWKDGAAICTYTDSLCHCNCT